MCGARWNRNLCWTRFPCEVPSGAHAPRPKNTTSAFLLSNVECECAAQRNYIQTIYDDTMLCRRCRLAPYIVVQKHSLTPAARAASCGRCRNRQKNPHVFPKEIPKQSTQTQQKNDRSPVNLTRAGRGCRRKIFGGVSSAVHFLAMVR